MEINDKVFGNQTIEEEVLIELIKSKPVQRLKGIQQAGVVYKVLPYKEISRYEHSVGTMLLIRKLGGSLEEQIAGLLHDVPHTAFSHAIDFVFRNDKHDYHEKFHEKIIKESEIPLILKKYDFDVERIIDEKNFLLLERNSPDLCADRVDYSLREFVARDGMNDRIKGYIDSLTVKDNEIVFDSGEKAKDFSVDFLYVVQDWGSPLQLVIVELIAEAVKIGLDEGILTDKDLFDTDENVLNKLEKSGNDTIKKKLDLLNPKLEAVEDIENHDYCSKEKARFVDPHFIVGNGLKRVSEEFPEFKKELDEHMIFMNKGVHARIVR
jgi:uncharacterized protein